jgi:peptide/nickel transport system substrate-binding protein
VPFFFFYMKQLRWQILVVVVALGIVAVLLFSQQTPSITGSILPQPEQGGVYTEGLVGSLGRLNPLLDWNNTADRDVDRLLFSGLVKFDERGLPQADVAAAWGVAQDGTEYNFSIRPNAVWQDGQPVTTDDVLFTIDRMKSAGSLYPQDVKDLWGKIEVTKLNDKTLKFKLPEPFVPFMDYLTFGILPKHLLESVPPDQMEKAEFNLQPVGSGPYKFDHLLIDKGQITGVVLTVSPTYYGKAPFIEQVVFRYYPTSSAALDAYQQGDVLAVSQITSDVLPTALEEQNLSIYTSRMPQMSFVLFNLNNTEVPFLQNTKVRRALMLGLNRPYMINTFLQGQAIVEDSPILPNSWAYYDGTEHFQYDPETAVSLLKGEGFVLPASGGDVRANKDNVSLSFTLLHPDDQTHTKIAETIRDEWAAIGVHVDLEAVPYDKLVLDSLTNRTYQAALVDLNLSRTPDPDPYPFWHQAEATGGQNYSQWDNRAASEYLEQARVTADYTLRAKLYRNFQVIFAKELPALPLYVPVYSYGVDSQVQGVQVGALYEPSDRLATFTSWYLLTRRALEQTEVPTSKP